MSTSGATLTVGNLQLDTLVNMGGLDAGFQQLQSRIKQIESATKITVTVDTAAATQADQALLEAQTRLATSTAQLRDAQTQLAASTTTLRTEQTAQAQTLGAAKTAATDHAAALTQQRTATEAVRTSTATTRDEITKLSVAQKQAAQDAKDHTAAHAPLQSALGGTSQLVQTLTMNMGGLGQGLQQATMAAGGFSGPLLAIGIPLAAVAVGLVAATKAAVDFQTTVVQVANNTQMTDAELTAMQEGVKQLALVIPASTTAMAEGWRHAADEGFNAADALKIVNAASMAAVNTGAQVTDTIFLVSQVLHAYHEPATDAMIVTNQLVEAAKQGNTTFSQMATNIGPLIAQAASLHIPLQDIVAAMSAMTQNGYPADQAVTGLTNLLKEVEAPSQKAKDAIAALGDRGAALVNDFTPAGLAGKGLYGVMKDLGDATDGDNAKILAILPQLRGFRSGVVLAGNGLDDYTKAMNNQADVMSGKLKPTQDDFARTMETVGAKMTILKNTVEVLAIDLGTIFLPVLTKVVQGMIDFATSIGLVSGASGFADIKKQIADVNDSYARTKSVQDAIAAANATSGDSATAAGTKAVEAATAHTNALDNTKTAAASLDEALGFPNGQQGIQDTVARLGVLQTSAGKEGKDAIDALDNALTLADGVSGPAAAKIAIDALKLAGNDATLVIQGLNAELASNKQALDLNAAQIQGVKDYYDPKIKADQAKITKINQLSPAELARKSDELNLDKRKADLELTKPDTSSYDAKILSDQTTLDNMPRLDTSTWDTNIANAQSSLEKLQDSDPAAGFKSEIASIQESMASLNTDVLDEKINHIKDTLAQPAPDTHGISNQLVALNEQLAGGTISQADFRSQYGALSLQKQGIETKYQDDTRGLAGQLKLLTQQRSDQALANKETAQADRQRISDLNDQVKVAEAGHKKDLADLQDYIKTQEAAKAKATKDDATARQKLNDDIKLEGNLRTQALKPYTDAMKKITDAQAHNAALDAAALAQRKIDLAPVLADMDTLKQKETDALAPLDLEKQKLDDNNKVLQEKVTQWKNTKAAIDAANVSLTNLTKNPLVAGSAPGTVGYGKGIMPGGYSPYDEPKTAVTPSPSNALSNFADAGGTGTATGLPGTDVSGIGELPLLTQFKALGDWVSKNGDMVKLFFGGLAISLAALGIIVAPGAALIVGLTALAGFFVYDYETNSTFKGFIDGLADAFNTLTDKLAAATNGMRTFLGLIPGKQPVGDNGTANFNPAFPPGGPVDANGNPIPQAVKGGDGGGGLGTFLGNLGGKVRGLFDPTGSSSPVSAGDLSGQMGEVDKFTQHIQDQLGDGGNAQAAIQAFQDQIKTEMGNGSDAATAVADAEKTFTDTFGTDGTVPTAVANSGQTIVDTYGQGGSVPDALTQTGDAATTTLGANGTVPTVLQILRDNHVPLTVAGLMNAFGQGGSAPTAITGTGDQATKTFGANGTFDQATANVSNKVGTAFGTDMPGHLTSFDQKFGGVLGTDGSAQGDMTSLDTHTSAIFGPDGTVVGYFTSVMNWLKGDWQGISGAISKPFTDAQTPIQSFFSYLGGGINWLAEHFKLTSITPYGGGGSQDIHATSGAGKVGAANLPGNNADGTKDWKGGLSWVGERGPEIVYLPEHAGVIPNHIAKNLPGFADGLNIGGVFDALSASRGGNLKGSAGPFTDTLMANLGQPAIPGLDGGGAALTGAVKDGVYNWLKDSSVNIGPLTGGRNAGGGSGFKGMTLAAYLAYLGGFGGPLDNESAFNDLMSVGQERGIDPRWFMAIMQTEDGFGTAAGDRLPQYNNYGGMGVRTGGLGFPSPVFATDGGPQPYAAFNSFRDFLEDEASWIAENGTSFAGYQTADAGQGKDAAFQQILAAIPAIGGQAAGPFQSGGFPDVLGSAQGDIGQMFHDNHAWNLWCEQFAEYAGEQSGYPHLGWGSALIHANSVQLNSGIGPPGSTMLWGSGYYPDGHAAISVGDGSVIGTSPQGVQQYDMSGANDYRGWVPPGLAEGGAFSVPTTVTVGDGGQREFVLPESDLRNIVRSEAGGVTISNLTVTVTVPPGTDAYTQGQRAADGLLAALSARGHINRPS